MSDSQPPTALHTWLELSPAERVTWLVQSRDRYFAAAHPLPQAAPGHVLEIDGRTITDVTSLLCAIGEAINGPGGYFGSQLLAFDDCCVGGFGATPPFTVRWTHAALSRQALDHAALAVSARAGLELLRQEDAQTQEYCAEGAAWYAQTIAQAERGEGVTFVRDAGR